MALDYCAALGFTLANTAGVDKIKPRALGMKGIEIDFDAIQVGESRSDVKAKKANSRVNLGEVPDHAKTEYISTDQRVKDEEPEDFIEIDVGEGQDFEALKLNHKLRRKLRRAIDNADIGKEMLVRQRALDYYNDKIIEIPPELRTPYKPINTKGQRILENGTLENAKQERVRARMELAEFNTQMRILRKQAKDAAIYAGLQKHAELIGRIPSTDAPVKIGEADHAEQDDGHADIMSALETSLPVAAPGAARAGLKRSQSESEDATSSESGDQPKEASSAPSTSDGYPNVESRSPAYGIRASKRQKERPRIDGSKLNNARSKSTNGDRQAMIDAELALTAKTKKEDGQMPSRSRSLRVVDGKLGHNSGRNCVGTGANSWNVDDLAGDKSRKRKFLRLLGGQTSDTSGNAGSVARSTPSAKYSDHINGDLERQYESGMAYKIESKRKGLGA